MVQFTRDLADEAATVALGGWLGQLLVTQLAANAVVFLDGDLGAGKTTLVRGMLQSLGHSGVVKSPTYTLLEPYQLGDYFVYHFDLYRVADPQELEFVGFDEIVDGPGLKLFEWPARAASWLPDPDLQVSLAVANAGTSRIASVRFAGLVDVDSQCMPEE